MLHKKLPKKVQQIVQEAKEQLQTIYSSHLLEMILFGSYARGDYSKGSDIDLLMLLDDILDPAAEREKYLPILCDLSLKHDTVVSLIPMRFSTYHQNKTPLILNVHKEGVRI
jgi:predicted nucleotidyltransferase